MSARPLFRHLGHALWALAVGGCSLGPAFERPQMALPEHYSIEGPWLPATPADALPKGQWWMVFGDPALNKLEDDALAGSQTLKAAVARLTQARAQITVASSALFPTVGVTGGATRSRDSINRPRLNPLVPNFSTLQNDYTPAFTVNYEPDLFGRVSGQVTESVENAAEVEAMLENTRLLVTSEVAADYYNLRELDIEIDVIRQSIDAQQHALEFVSSRHDLGIASGLDLAQQQALLDSTTTQIDLLRNQRGQLQHAIAALVGAPASSFLIAPQESPLIVPRVPTGVPSDLLERRPDVAAAERAVAISNASIGVALAAYFPNLTLSGQYGRESTELANLFSAPSVAWVLGLSLTETIFDAGRRSANVEIARAATSEASANYRDTVLTAVKEVEDGLTGLTTLARASDEAQRAVASSQRALDLANDRYSGGLATYLDVITAEGQVLTNQRQAAQIKGQELVTAVYLVKALGGGWQGIDAPVEHPKA